MGQSRRRLSTGATGDLPFVNQHSLRISASPDQVWHAVERYAASSVRIPDRSPLALVLGTEPRAGFELAAARPPESLTLTGRHRFSRYALRFDVLPAGAGRTELRALTFAEFPGAAGRLYRALVIGTGAHVLATRHLLRSVRRLAVDGG